MSWLHDVHRQPKSSKGLEFDDGLSVFPLLPTCNATPQQHLKLRLSALLTYVSSLLQHQAGYGNQQIGPRSSHKARAQGFGA